MAGSGRERWDSATGSWIPEPESTEEPEAASDAADSAQQPPAQQPPAQQPAAGKTFFQKPSQKLSFEQLISDLSRKVPHLPLILLGAAVLAAAVLAVLVLKHPKKAPSFEDLGAGISDVDGLRGHLTTRWAGHAEYKLSFEPLYPLQSAGFSAVVSKPPQPFWVNIRLLDATGYALCGKQILFQFDPSQAAGDVALQTHASAKKADQKASAQAADLAAQEQQREQGKDVFQNQLGDNGQVAAVTSQGALPCSARQYKQASYWDFTTNFPTLTQQDALLKQRARAAKEARRRREALRYRHSYSVEGDATVSGYNSSTGMLQTRSGSGFFVLGARSRGIARAWASIDAVIHYRCNQFTNCRLTRSGDGRMVYARSTQ